jgi:hypothetical protein
MVDWCPVAKWSDIQMAFESWINLSGFGTAKTRWRKN